MHFGRAFLAAGILALAACGGGGGSSDDGPPESDATTYTGQVFDAAVANADVRVESLDGDVLATTTTDSAGEFTVDVEEYEHYYRFVAEQGSYTEQATGNRIQLDDQTLSAVVHSGTGQRSVSINILSHLLAGRFLYKLEQEDTDDGSAMRAAEAAAEGYGDVAPSEVTLEDLSAVSSTSSLTPGAKASLYSAGVSQFAENRMAADGYTGMQTASEYSSIAFAQTLYQDVRADGRLDGQGSSGQLTFGSLKLDSNVYRDGLALAMIDFIRSGQNSSALEVADVLDYAERMSGLQNYAVRGLFSTQPPEPISEIEPTISNLTPGDQSPVFGTTEFTLDAVDFAGVDSIAFTFGDEPTRQATDLDDPSFSVDTTAFADDTYPVEVAVTNLSGTTATREIEVIVSNDGTTISGLDPGGGDVIRGTYPFGADIHDPVGLDQQSFYINGQEEFGLSQTGTRYSKDIDTTALTDGEHDFRVSARNSVGDETDKTATFTVDNTAPEVTNYPVSDGDYLEGEVVFDPTITDANEVVRGTLFVDGKVEAEYLDRISHTLDTTNLDEGDHTLRFETEDEAGNVTTIETDVTVDNEAPTVEITSPQDGITATSEFTLFWDQEDAAGWGDARAEVIVGEEHYGFVSNHVEARSININNRPTGWNECKVIVTDGSGKTAEASIMVNFQPE